MIAGIKHFFTRWRIRRDDRFARRVLKVVRDEMDRGDVLIIDSAARQGH